MEDIDSPGVIQGSRFQLPGTGILPRRKRLGPRFFFVFIVIGMFVALGTFIGSWNDHTLTYQDTYLENAQFIDGGPPTVDLSISNVAGSVTIDQTSLDPGNLFEIETKIYTNEKGKEIYHQTQWNIMSTEVNHYDISFKAPDKLDSARIEYSHSLHFAAGISFTSFTVSTISGSINIILDNQAIQSPNFDAISGHIDVDFNQVNVSKSLRLDATSGMLSLGIRNSNLDVETMTLETISGSSHIKFINNKFEKPVALTIDHNSGTLDLLWNQQTLNTSLSVAISLISGSVNADLIFSPSITTEYHYDSNDISHIPADHLGDQGNITFNLSVMSGTLDISYSNP